MKNNNIIKIINKLIITLLIFSQPANALDRMFKSSFEENTPPSITSVGISPALADATSLLTCIPVADDIDGGFLTFEYEWLVNGTLLVGQSNESLNGLNFNRGDSVKCRVKAFDGFDFSGSVSSDSISIVNARPSISSVTISWPTATESFFLTCIQSGSSDADGDSLSFTYRWEVDEVTVSTEQSIDGQSLNSGDTIRCFVTAFDGFENSNEVSSSSISINTPPTVGSVSLTPTTAYEGSNFLCTASNVGDVDGDTVTLTYTWTNDSQTIIGQDQENLGGSSFNKNDTIACQVTPNDGTVDGTIASSNAVIVENTKPTAPSVRLLPGIEFEDLLCTVAGATDVDPADSPLTVYDFIWLMNGVPYTGALINTSYPNDTIPAVAVAGGNSFTCEARAVDGSGEAGLYGSDFVSIYGGI